MVFAWADGSRGELIELMKWAGARLLLLVFGDLSGSATQRLQKLSKDADLRCVQVLAPGGSATATEHVIDTQGHLQATCHVFGHA